MAVHAVLVVVGPEEAAFHHHRFGHEREVAQKDKHSKNPGTALRLAASFTLDFAQGIRKQYSDE